MDSRVHARWIAPKRAHLFLCLKVSLVISEEQERIVDEQIVHKWTKQFHIATPEPPRWR